MLVNVNVSVIRDQFFFPGTGIWILENEKCWCELLIRCFFSTGLMKVCVRLSAEAYKKTSDHGRNH